MKIFHSSVKSTSPWWVCVTWQGIINICWKKQMSRNKYFDIIRQSWVCSVQFSPVTQLCPTLQSHRRQQARPPCPSPTPGVNSDSCPSSQWCYPTISSSVVPFSSHLQSFLASGSFQMSQFFTSGGQSAGLSASASVLPMDIQDWFPLGWTGWLSLQFKGLSRVFSNSTVQKYKFFGAQLSL